MKQALFNTKAGSQSAIIYWFVMVLIMAIGSVQASEDDTNGKQESFEWVFGDLAIFDPVMVQKVLSDQAGKRHYVDHNGDGKPEEVWFIDIEPHHYDSHRPLLVRVIDEDGDLEMGGQPDLDSDLYMADWNANGTIDAAVDYEDTDGDQDADQMGMYFDGGTKGLRVWWSRDDGDDNLLWYDVDYLYYQNPCQNFTHFGGDESFVALYIKPGTDHWTPYWENPFLFFDRDQDGVTEEVVRISGEDNLIRSLRWSFDVDNDATLEHPRDFDVSISAYANFHFGEAQTETLTIRGFPTGPVLARKITTSFLNEATWDKVLMTWDENDLNIAWHRPGDYIERWEGVIAAPSTEPGYEFPVIGGPNCGPFNKRYELVLQPDSPNEYYFNPADHRIHLRNSDKTWIKVDYDGDDQADMHYLWTDTDNDGIMDRMSADVDGDGQTDDSWPLDISGIKPVKWTFENLNPVFAPVVFNEPQNIYLLNKNLTTALESIQDGLGQDPVWDLIEQKMKNGNFSDDIADRLINSDETMLYYLTLSCDRRIDKLKKSYTDHTSFWKSFDAARRRGDTKTMSYAVSEEFKLPALAQDYDKWLSSLREKPEKKLVAWDNEWRPPNWGWESEKAAFRCYDGHFDLFGKRVDTLIYPTIDKDKDYHIDENGWGMDILHVGNTGGCGGLVLYVDGVAYPVRNEKNPGDPVFTARLLKETSDSVCIEFTARGVGPKETPYTVYIRPTAVAGRFDSPIEVYIEGGAAGQKTELGIVLNILPEETFFVDTTAGIMGLWGFQQPEIGWIGTGIVFPPDRFLNMDEQADEHRVVLKYQPGEFIHYHIQGDWLRGHRFSRCPGQQEWMNTLKKTAEKANLKEVSGLVGFWALEETSGTIAFDSSGNNNDGMIYGPVSTTGVSGLAFQFDGIDDYLDVSKSVSLDNITDEITIIAWVNTSLGTRQTLLERWLTGDADERSFELDIDADGKVNFALSWNGTNSVSVLLTSSDLVTSDTWTHIAATSDGSTMKIYINGMLDPETKTSPSSIHPSAAGIHIGRWEFVSGQWCFPFKGTMDEVKIYNKALSAQEITDDCNLAPVGIKENPVFLPLEDGLLQAYPNPFNSLTTIRYKTAVSGKVTISIYNLSGQKIRTLVNETQQADNYSVVWDGTNATGGSAGSGIYFCTLSIDNKPVAVKKLVLFSR